jgi:hypothetical protein
MIYEIINPSDAVCIEADDIASAGIAVMMLSSGYGLHDDKGNSVVPITMFGGGEQWLKQHGIDDAGKYIKENALKLAKIFESVFYGKPSDKEMFDKALSKMTPEGAEEYKREWNDKRRTSLTNIESSCLSYAKKLRELATKENINE